MTSTHASENSQKNEEAAKAQENKVSNQLADNQAHEKVEDDQPNLTGQVAPGPANRDLRAPENNGQ